MDAQPMPDRGPSGKFDPSGMLSALAARIRKMSAQRVVVQAGERNRGLSTIKCRGMAYSNQMRDLSSDAGVTDTRTEGFAT
jgi:hypothetical protein